MNIKKIIVAILLSTLFLACMESKEVKLVKNGILYGYENKTLGEAVEGFFEDPTWEKITGTDGNIYVNVSGKILYGDLEVEVILQYLVESDGSFTFNAIEVDEVPHDVYVYRELLEKMYE